MNRLAPEAKRCRCLCDPIEQSYERGVGLCWREMTGEDLLCDLCRHASTCTKVVSTYSGRLLHGRYFTRETYLAMQQADDREQHTHWEGYVLDGIKPEVEVYRSTEEV